MAKFNRRSFLSFVPAAAVAGSESIRGIASSKHANTQASFCDIPSKFISPDTHQIHTLGYSVPGDRGHATYVSDHLATPELAALAPLFSKVSADGRHWRAAINSDGLLPVSAGGAVGMMSVRQWGAGNQQPTIAQALIYQQAIGAKGLTFTDGNFSIWCPYRRAVDDDIYLSKSGIPFLIKGPTILQSGPNGTTFNRRKFDGSDPAIFNGTQYLSYNKIRNGRGVYWRGGMFMLVGKLAPRPEYTELTTLHLKGKWCINGGILQSPNHAGLIGSGNPEYYDLNPDGSGWDVSDQPVWAENDRNTGDIIFEGNITIGGFRGELIYQAGGITHGSIYQTGTLTLHNTDGNGFNPSPTFSNTLDGYGTVQIESLIIHDALQGLEGSTGWNSKIDNLKVVNCTRSGGLMAGIYGIAAQPTKRPPPFLDILNLEVSASAFYTVFNGNKIKNIISTDTTIWIGQSDWNTYNVDIENINIIVDKYYLADGVCFWGGPDASHGTHSNHISTVTLTQTSAARAAGYCTIDPVDWFGPFGADNKIENLNGIAWMSPVSRNAAYATGGIPEVENNNLKYLYKP